MSKIVSIIILIGKEFNVGIQGPPWDQANHKVPSEGLDPKYFINQEPVGKQEPHLVFQSRICIGGIGVGGLKKPIGNTGLTHI